jgi:hypothetical protein
MLIQMTQQHPLPSLTVVTDQGHTSAIAQGFNLQDPLLHWRKRLPSSISQAQLQAFSIPAGHHRKQVGPGVPPDLLAPEGQTPQIPTKQIQPQRPCNGLAGIHQKPQTILSAEPAVWKIRIQ